MTQHKYNNTKHYCFVCAHVYKCLIALIGIDLLLITNSLVTSTLISIFLALLFPKNMYNHFKNRIVMPMSKAELSSGLNDPTIIIWIIMAFFSLLFSFYYVFIGIYSNFFCVTLLLLQVTSTMAFVFSERRWFRLSFLFSYQNSKLHLTKFQIGFLIGMMFLCYIMFLLYALNSTGKNDLIVGSSLYLATGFFFPFFIRLLFICIYNCCNQLISSK